ncbi:hypothetical protein CAQ69_15395, partial [Stutzerimonas stutzeri]
GWLICWMGLGMWFALMDLDQFLPHHPGLAALDSPRSIAAPGAGVQGPSMALYAFRGIHAAHSPTQRLHSAS